MSIDVSLTKWRELTLGSLGVEAGVEDPERHAAALALPVEEPDQALQVGGVQGGRALTRAHARPHRLVQGLEPQLVRLAQRLRRSRLAHYASKPRRTIKREALLSFMLGCMAIQIAFRFEGQFFLVYFKILC